MKYFVSADIHGFYDEWQLALKEKGFDINNSEHKIILCGDLFDRGRQPKEIIDFVLTHKDKVILIRGNHEDLMQEMIDRNKLHLRIYQTELLTLLWTYTQSGKLANLIYPKLQKKQDFKKFWICALIILKPNITYLCMVGYLLLKTAIFMIVNGEVQGKSVGKRLVGQTLLKCIDTKSMNRTKQ